VLKHYFLDMDTDEDVDMNVDVDIRVGPYRKAKIRRGT
jgi:hypothetical protein